MENWQEFFIQYWLEISMPVAMLLASLWLRATSFHLLERWRAKGDGEPVAIFIASTRSATRLWVLLLTLFVANHSLWVLSEWRTFANRVIGTIFILSLFWISIRLGQGLLRVYLSKAGLPTVMLPWLLNLVRVGVAFTVAMLLLDIWGISTTPIILVLAVVALVAALGLKDAVPNLLASFRLTSRLSFHKGDFIKLDTGEEGYVTEVAWGRTRIRGLDNSLIVLPNNKIVLLFY
ncbi:MAG: mechanosensitive ion channel family protein [Dehalococcoidia bacterium]|nr:mechanosensitive ion channel family protein [Dehalococcoidia bacterium]